MKTVYQILKDAHDQTLNYGHAQNERSHKELARVKDARLFMAGVCRKIEKVEGRISPVWAERALALPKRPTGEGRTALLALISKMVGAFCPAHKARWLSDEQERAERVPARTPVIMAAPDRSLLKKRLYRL